MTKKLLGTYTLRLPVETKQMIDALPSHMKKKLNQEILIAIAKVLHENAFDPTIYLGSEFRRGHR